MKKIIVNGGEFYKLHPLANLTTDFAASTLVDIATVESGKIYRIEISLTNAVPTLYGGGNYYVRQDYTLLYVSDSKAIFTVRAAHNGTLQMRYASAQSSVTINIYEYAKFENVKLNMNLDTANEVKGTNDCNVFLMPVLASGTTYKMSVTALWTGYIQVYDSSNNTVLAKTACTNGDVFEFDYACPSDNGYPKVRSFVANQYCYFKINASS